MHPPDHKSATPLCVLLAGRRPDLEDTDDQRFPIGNVVLVRERIRGLLVERRPAHLVCSAACGADLLALDAAGDLGIKRHVVLPFSVSKFRASSVTDRPGAWGTLYDRLLQEVVEAGDLTVLGGGRSGDDAYTAVNERLVEVAFDLGSDVLAVAVWEGAPRGDVDFTFELLQAAKRAGAQTAEVLTR